jgi:hypothetical protein
MGVGYLQAGREAREQYRKLQHELPRKINISGLSEKPTPKRKICSRFGEGVQKAWNLVRAVLKIGIEGDEVSSSSLQGEHNARLQGCALAEINRVRYDVSTGSSCEGRCCIGGTIIDDNNIRAEAAQRQNGLLDGSLFIIGRDNNPNRVRLLSP